jgi:hypothetical protein
MNMFGIVMNTAEKRLSRQISRTMNEAFKLSRNNRKRSDQKYVEADRLMKQLEALKRNAKVNG